MNTKTAKHVRWTHEESKKVAQHALYLLKERGKPTAVKALFEKAQTAVLHPDRRRSTKVVTNLMNSEAYAMMESSVEVAGKCPMSILYVAPREQKSYEDRPSPEPVTPPPVAPPGPPVSVDDTVDDAIDMVITGFNSLLLVVKALHDRQDAWQEKMEERYQTLEDLLMDSAKPNTNPEPEPEPQPQPEVPKPRVGVYGPLPAQLELLRSRLPHLDVCEIRDTGAASRSYDAAFLVARFAKHQHQDQLRKAYGDKFELLIGKGISSWAFQINQWSLKK